MLAARNQAEIKIPKEVEVELKIQMHTFKVPPEGRTLIEQNAWFQKLKQDLINL